MTSQQRKTGPAPSLRAKRKEHAPRLPEAPRTERDKPGDPPVAQATTTVRSASRETGAFEQTILRPTTQAALTVQVFEKKHDEVDLDIRELVVGLAQQVASVHAGNLKPAEEMLFAQAQSLDAIFGSLARRAATCEILSHLEAFLRLALKAQSQCRATLETLAQIKNPPVVIARQANVTTGPQQVNNGITSRARETEIAQTKLLEAQHGERVDFGAAGAAIGADPAMAPVGELDRAEDVGRKGAG